jgi:hypothetical protein
MITETRGFSAIIPHVNSVPVLPAPLVRFAREARTISILLITTWVSHERCLLFSGHQLSFFSSNDGKRSQDPSQFSTIATERLAAVNAHPLEKQRLTQPYRRWKLSKASFTTETMRAAQSSIFVTGSLPWANNPLY